MRPNYPYMAVFVSITWRFFSGLGNTPKKNGGYIVRYHKILSDQNYSCFIKFSGSDDNVKK